MPFYPTSSSGGGGGGALKRIGSGLDYEDIPAWLANESGDYGVALMEDQTLEADVELPAGWTGAYLAVLPGVTLTVADNNLGVASGGTVDFTIQGFGDAKITRGSNGGEEVFQGAGDFGRLSLLDIHLNSTSTTANDGWFNDTNNSVAAEIYIRNVKVTCGNHLQTFIRNENTAKLVIDGLYLMGGGTSCGSAVYVRGTGQQGTTAIISNVEIYGSWNNSHSNGAINCFQADAELLKISNVVAWPSVAVGLRLDGSVTNVGVFAEDDADIYVAGYIRGLEVYTNNTTPDVTVAAGTKITDFYLQANITLAAAAQDYTHFSNGRFDQDAGFSGTLDGLAFTDCYKVGSLSGDNIRLDNCRDVADAVITYTGDNIVCRGGQAGTDGGSSARFAIGSGSTACLLDSCVGVLPATNAGDGCKIIGDRTFVGAVGTFGHADLDSILDYLVGYFAFDESLPNTFRNLAPRPRMLDMSSETSGVTMVSTGPDGNGVSLAATSDYIASYLSSPAHGAYGEMSLNCWFSPDDATPAAARWALCCSTYTTANTGIAIGFDTSGRATLWSHGGQRATSASQELADGVPSMLTLVKRNVSGTMTNFVYIDGVEVCSSATAAATTGRGNGVNFGRLGNINQAHEGDYSALSVWSKALSTAEISALYNSGSGRFLLGTSS